MGLALPQTCATGFENIHHRLKRLSALRGWATGFAESLE
jgi:hypothetical protein